MAQVQAQKSLFDLIEPAARAKGGLETRALPDDCDAMLARELARELHLALEEQFDVVDLVFTDNRRRMVSIRKRKNRYQIRLHHMFLGCESAVVEGVIGLASKSKAPAARKIVKDYIRNNRDSIRSEVDEDNLTTEGEAHDLSKILEDVRGSVGEHDVDDVAITWGRRGRGRRSIRFGSFDFDRRLIRIHPALDADWVPRFFVEFVVYHELMHAICPPDVSQTGRRIIHTAEFREREAAFPRYDEAMRWEAANLRRLLDR